MTDTNTLAAKMREAAEAGYNFILYPAETNALLDERERLREACDAMSKMLQDRKKDIEDVLPDISSQGTRERLLHDLRAITSTLALNPKEPTHG